MRYLIGGLVAVAVLALSSAPASAAPVVYCGIVKANSVATGAGSGARVLELQATTGPGGVEQRFSVPDPIPLPTIGSYICGQFEQGAPSMGLLALMRPGDTGYVTQPGVATLAPPTAPLPSVVPVAVAPPAAPFTLGFIELLLASLGVLLVAGLLVARTRRAATA